MDNTVTIKFANHEKAKNFVDWMSNQGEQDYWLYFEILDDPMADNFDYDYENLVITEKDDDLYVKKEK
jgi:hypothetical protein